MVAGTAMILSVDEQVQEHCDRTFESAGLELVPHQDGLGSLNPRDQFVPAPTISDILQFSILYPPGRQDRVQVADMMHGRRTKTEPL